MTIIVFNFFMFSFQLLLFQKQTLYIATEYIFSFTVTKNNLALVHYNFT